MTATQVLRGVAEVIAGSPRFLTAPLIRNRHLRWGATDAEVAAVMPGDEIVPDASFNATRAITIDAPRERVWAWIVQMGYGRAGFYSYDIFDNGGCPSADEVLPEYQHPRVGDWVPMASKISEKTAFKVKAFEPPEWMLWEKRGSTWSWRLVAIEEGRTRLITRLKDRRDWSKPGSALLSLILLEIGDFPMMRKQLLGIKTRAERRPVSGRS